MSEAIRQDGVGLDDAASSAWARYAIATGLNLPPNLPRDEWEQVGSTLRQIERSVLWWLGDWWLYGEREYGEAASQAAPTGYALQTVKNAAWVASRFPNGPARRDDLPFSHHATVAGLEEPDRERLLDAAAEHRWSRGELREEVRRSRPPDPAPLPPCDSDGEPDENGEVGYGLLMPFVVVASKGGPYQDESFCAGWECAQLDAALAANPTEHRVTLRSGSVPQGDLIAMRHGFAMAAEEWPDDGTWTLCTFTRN